MPEQVIRAALRIRFCFAEKPHKRPNPADVERLRQAVSGKERDWPVGVLAAHILQRGMDRRQQQYGQRRKA
jgi:hypothetical protein